MLTAALVVPYFIDWTSYRADFEREASRALGRKVIVAGTATARILPFPSVTFTDVEVPGATPDQPQVKIDRFSMDAELAPFLRGELLIFDMRIVRPRVTVNIGKDGTVDWAVRPATPFDPRQITLENITVTDGEVTVIHGASGSRHELTHIDAKLSARSLAGPWQFDGTLDADGLPAVVKLSTGIANAKGKMRLHFHILPRNFPVALDADGDAHFRKAAALYDGEFRIGPRSAEDRKALGLPAPAAAKEAKQKPELPYRITGSFALDHKRLSLTSFRLETGPTDDPYAATGSAYVDLGASPNFSVKARGDQVRLDDSQKKGAAAPGLALDSRIAAFEKMVKSLPKPAIPGKVDVTLPAIVAGDTTVRQVRLVGQTAAGGWTLEKVSALLPGRTTLEAHGFLRTDRDFGFKGSLLLAVAQPSGFAAWVARDVNDAIRRLPSAGFNADVDLTRTKQEFSNLELILGDAKFHGSIDSREPAGAPPSMTVKLTGGKLDVDGMMAFASLFVSDTGMNRLADRNLDLEVKAGPVTAGGLAAKSIDTALRLKGGRIDIDRLKISGLAGATIDATGNVTGFPANPTGEMKATIAAADLAPLAKLVADRYPGNALAAALQRRASHFTGLLKDAQIDLAASAKANGKGGTDSSVSARGSIGGSAFDVAATLAGRGSAPAAAEVSLKASLKNADAAPLYALFGLPALPLGVTGAAKASVSAEGSLADGVHTSLSVHGQGLDGSFDGVVKRGEGGATEVSGKADLVSGDLSPWLMTAGVAIPGMALGLPIGLKAAVSCSGGPVAISGLKGKVAGTPISGDLAMTVKAGLPVFSGKLAAGTVDLSTVAQMILGEGAFQAKPGKWPARPFLANAAPAFGVDLDVTAGSLLAGPLAATNAQAHVALGANGLRLDSLSATLDGGRLTGLFDLKNNGGAGLLSGQFQLKGAAMGRLFDAGLGGKGDISASVTATGKSVEAMIASLAGSGTSAFSELRIPGLDPTAFAAIISKADAIGRDIDAAKTAAFAPQLVHGGAFVAQSGALAFTIVGGVLRAPPLQLKAPGAILTSDVKVDFSQLLVTASGDIAYDPGDQALVGSEPSVGFTAKGAPSAMRVKLNLQPLVQYLTQRALEKEEARVEAMQASLLEKQRLHREIAYYAALDKAREEAAEAARQKARAEAAQAAAAAAAGQAAQKAGEAGPQQSPPQASAPPQTTQPQAPPPRPSTSSSDPTLQKMLQEEIQRDIEAAGKRDAGPAPGHGVQDQPKNPFAPGKLQPMDLLPKSRSGMQ